MRGIETGPTMDYAGEIGDHTRLNIRRSYDTPYNNASRSSKLINFHVIV